MERWVLLLRGVNVGGRNRVPMDRLRGVLTDLGYDDVDTYIQSGNVAFDAPSRPDPGHLSALLGRELGCLVPAVVLARSELVEVLERNPFGSLETDPKLLHVLFFSHEPDADDVARLDHRRYAPDRFEITGRAAYVHFPNGSARSKLTIDVFERGLDVTATGRNLRTALRLVGL